MQYKKLKCGCEIPIVNGKIHIDYDNLNDQCPKTWELYLNGHTRSIFQLESRLCKSWARELIPSSMKDAADLIAIVRPGCVSEDSKILVNIGTLKTNNRKYKKYIKIKDIFKNKTYYKEIVSIDEKTGQYIFNQVLDVFPTGQKECFKIKIRKYRNNLTINAKEFKKYDLECTADHKLLTPNGWTELKDLKIGDRIAVEKATSKRNNKKDTISNRHLKGLRYKNVKGTKYYQQICYKHYYEKCCVCGWNNANLDTNHINGNRHTNNDFNNLCFLCPNCHREYSLGLISKTNIKKYQKQNKLPVLKDIDWVTYEGCESVGIKNTYDISMCGPNHNFVANQVLVHNCLNGIDENGKSMTKIFCDRKTGKEEFTPASLYEKLLADTYSIIVYQEQLLFIAKQIAGFDGKMANKLMKGVGKKNAELLFSLEKAFLEGCNNTNAVSQDEAKKIFENIKASARYLFNKCVCPTSTFVETSDGLTKNIESLSVGEFVNSPDGYIEVIDKFSTGEKELYEVELESGKVIRCTLDHKFLCEDNKIHPLYFILENNLKIVEKE